MSTHDHLDPIVIPLLSLSRNDRAEYILGDRFIVHDRIGPVIDKINFLVARPRRSRARGLVVYGPPGSGKSMLSKSIQRKFPIITSDKDASQLPVVAIDMTNAREAEVIYKRLLRKLGVPNYQSYTGSDREQMVIKICIEAKVRLIIFDEIQDILTSTARQQRIALDTIKMLMNELSASVLVLGTHQAHLAMKLDPHLDSRFEYRELPIWKNDKFTSRLLASLERFLPLKQQSKLNEATLMSRILALSGSSLSDLIELVTFAAAHAVESGEERVSQDSVTLAAAGPPMAAIRRELDALSVRQTDK